MVSMKIGYGVPNSHEPPGQRAGPTDEPFVHRDDRAVIFSRRARAAMKGMSEMFFYGHEGG